MARTMYGGRAFVGLLVAGAVIFYFIQVSHFIYTPRLLHQLSSNVFSLIQLAEFPPPSISSEYQVQL